MATFSTPVNNTGRVIDGKRLVDLQNFITRVAPTFGMTVVASEVPTALDPVNIDAIRIEIDNLAKAVRRNNGPLEGSGRKFIQWCNQVGVQLSQGPTIVDSVTGLAVSNEGILTADVDWDAYVPADGGDVTYDIQYWDTDANPDVLELTDSDLAFGTSNPALQPLTNYKARIRAKWNSGTSVTPWSSYVTFATLAPTAPVGLAVGTIGATTATADWTAKVIQAFTVHYDLEIREQVGDALIFSSYDQAAITKAITGLTTATDYYAIVRAKWTDGAVKYTAYSAHVNFTTL